MNPIHPLHAIAPEIKKGPPIQSLHQAFQFLPGEYAEILSKTELKAQQLGPTTLKALRAFQQDNCLCVTGQIDEATARRFNELLFENQVFRRIVGVCYDPAGLPKEGIKLRAVCLKAGDTKSVDETVTDETGAYQLYYDPKQLAGGPTVTLLVQLADESEPTDQCSIPIKHQHATTTVNFHLNAVKPPSNSGVMKIQGLISRDNRLPVEGLQVQAFDQSLSTEKPLGQAITDADGRYLIQYKTTDLPAGKSRPDLLVKVVLPAKPGQVMARSAVVYNAGPETVIDLVVKEKDIPKVSEFERLMAAIRPFLDGKSLGELQENAKHQDFTYLARKTGWDARMIAMASLAAKSAAETKLSAEYFYASFRSGLPTDADALRRVPVQTLQEAWKKAAAANIVPAQFGQKTEAALKVFEGHRGSQLLEGKATGAVSTLKEILNVSLGSDAALQKKFANLYFNHTGSPAAFWEKAKKELRLSDTKIQTLRLDGKLGFLTSNHAPLISYLKKTIRLSGVPDLVTKGFYKKERWLEVIQEQNFTVPDNIPGKDAAEKRERYAESMARQMKRSYPTAILAEMVRAGEMPLSKSIQAKSLKNGKQSKDGDSPGLHEQVYAFFTENPEFEIGRQPLKQYLSKSGVGTPSPEVTAEVARLQRTWQISPNDDTMRVLLEQDLDSAYAIMQSDETSFIHRMGIQGIGESAARMTWNQAHTVHSTVLQLTTAVGTYLTNPKPYVLTGATTLEAIPKPKAKVGGYPTLEELFGDFDYCDCDHCRSILSPAAYLVDLLTFIDRDPASWGGTGSNPFHVLQLRRPDIEHLELTCENTNTVLPYIDLVNEILEYYVLHGNIQNFKGYNSGEMDTEEVLATPEFVGDHAYDQTYERLNNQVYPATLPFNEPLESLRLLMEQLEIPLAEAMEKLRKNEVFDPVNPAFGWNDILMEQLKISPQEFKVLTDSTLKTLPQYFGQDGNMNFNDFDAALCSAKTFCRTLNISYKELTELLRTTFINPHAALIIQLENLRLDHTANAADQIGDVSDWLTAHHNDIMQLIVLTPVAGASANCGFSQLELRYALPDVANNHLKEVDYRRFYRFIRLWKKLGWSIADTDLALRALFQHDLVGATPTEKLDAGFRDFLPRLALALQARNALQLKGKTAWPGLLAFWAHIDTFGHKSLYHQLFLNPSIRSLPEVFKDTGSGFLPDLGAPAIKDHKIVLLAAFNFIETDFQQILSDANLTENSLLTRANVSALYRRALLCKALKIRPIELKYLCEITNLDPFASLSYTNAQGYYSRPDLLQFIDFNQEFKNSGLQLADLRYILRSEDPEGKIAPKDEVIFNLIKTLRDGLKRIEAENTVKDDPKGEATAAAMALVFDKTDVDQFFGLLNHTTRFETAYSDPVQPNSVLLNVSNPQLTYDNLAKNLVFAGVMAVTERDNLKQAGSTSVEFTTAIDLLFEQSNAFFQKYPGWLNWYYDFQAVPSDPLEIRFRALLENILPELKSRLKKQLVRQTLAELYGAEPALLDALLDDATLLDAFSDSTSSAIFDFIRPESEGSAEITNLPLNYWLEVPAPGNWNLYLYPPTAVSDASILNLKIDGEEITMGQTMDGQISNVAKIVLSPGKFYHLELGLQGLIAPAVLKWESAGQGKTAIPAASLYPADAVEHLKNAFLRLFKIVRLANNLSLTASEVVYFGNEWPVTGNRLWNSILGIEVMDLVDQRTVVKNILDLSRYKALKNDLKIKDESLTLVFAKPALEVSGERLLFRLTGWDQSNLTSLLGHFNKTDTDLKDLNTFLRVRDAFYLVHKAGIAADQLLEWTGNQPVGATVRQAKQTLRAQYDETDWRNVVKPHHDRLRQLRRRALVDYVIYHQMLPNTDTAHINSPEKLYEYFLIDVEMEPCMETSRIRQAISSVQQFVFRCLMNLESKVSPSIIPANHWEWMKRYRIWEANRKVFLWPENWLDPELRDNKTPFFDDLQSELLQSDVTAELAEQAYIHYLGKLEDVAKLEICATYLEENGVTGDNQTADDILHVFGRTSGLNRQYYYRRFEYGYWTPWEKVDADIEDNPILPVIWKGRLILFWLTIIKKGQEGKALEADKKPQDLTNAQLNAFGQISVEVNLCWSEYYNGKWQAKRTSDFKTPLVFSNLDPNLKVKGWMAYRISPDFLRIIFTLNDNKVGNFDLENLYSNPVGAIDTYSNLLPFLFARRKPELNSDFKIFYANSVFPSQGNGPSKHEILKSAPSMKIVEPVQHDKLNLLELPFFTEDRRHVMHVFPDYKEWKVSDWEYYGGHIHTTPVDVTVEDVIHVVSGEGPILQPYMDGLQPLQDISSASGQQPWVVLPGNFGVLQTGDGWNIGIDGGQEQQSQTSFSG